MGEAATRPALSFVIPVYNEEANVGPLHAELTAVARGLGRSYELVFVNDGSRDQTLARLLALGGGDPHLRVVELDGNFGEAAAVSAGFGTARGEIVVTLDGDGQNDPAFIPSLVEALTKGGASVGLVQGQRIGRKDTAFKRFQSRVANGVRRWMLADGTRDTGCGLKCFPREVYLALPYFDALHRFMPALVKREGYEVKLVDVVDRSRLSGTSNYGMFDRLWVGIRDLVGVSWLIARRRRIPEIEEG
jgi:glycosyltransferase involved in cell wall biosynthesis